MDHLVNPGRHDLVPPGTQFNYHFGQRLTILQREEEEEEEEEEMGARAQKRRSNSLLSLACGCNDSKSVSVSGVLGSKSALGLAPVTGVAVTEFSSAETLTLTSVSSSLGDEEEEDDTDDAAAVKKMERSASTPSFSELLCELNELEQSVMAWGSCVPPACAADCGRGEKKTEWQSGGGGGGGKRAVEDSVVVVKETEDPLGEFRRSMLQMIVEKQIVDGAELKELLRRFLALNSQRHHGIILRAFAEIWEDVFAGYERTPELLRRGYSRLPPRRCF